MLILIVSPIVYRFAIIPLQKQTAKTIDAIDQLESLNEILEQRVAERTTDLEIARRQSENHAYELQSIGEISKVITGEQKLENLLPLITRLVSERFGFYHTGIFLIDETSQFAILQAANSEGGKNMLARGHQARGWRKRDCRIRCQIWNTPHRPGRWAGSCFLQQSRPSNYPL